MIDYHVHEVRSRDTKGATIQAYVKAAEVLGIREIAFTTHLITAGPDVDISIKEDEIPGYIEEIQRAQSGTDVTLLVGLEVDYFPEEERHLERILSEHQFDLILGSTHYINGVDIGNRTLAEVFFRGRSISEGVNEYYMVWRRALETGLFDVMAHPDYWRKYVHLFREPPRWQDYGSVVYDALDSAAESEVGIEVNTSGYRHGIGSAFPLQEFLIAAKEAGIETVTVGSDSHYVGGLGYKLDDALRQLRGAGFTKISTFRGRKNNKITINSTLRKSN